MLVVVDEFLVGLLGIQNFQIPENFEFPEFVPRTRRQQLTMADTNAASAVVAVPETWHVNTYHKKIQSFN